jgi:type IV pilus assembly protein PilN
MIKINLLPIRAARKREYVKQQLALFIVLIVGSLIVCYLLYNNMANKIADRKKQITNTKQQIEQYKKAIGEVERYKGLEAMLNRKLEIIDSLIKGKTGPVRVLDRLSTLIPKQVWLLEWKEKSGIVEVKGEALTNKHVAQFLAALEEPLDGTAKSSEAVETAKKEKKKKRKFFFTEVTLVETKSIDAKSSNQTFIEFKIKMKVHYAI